MARLVILSVLVFIGSVQLTGQEPAPVPAPEQQTSGDAAAKAPSEALEALLQALRDAVAAADELSQSETTLEGESPRDPFSATAEMRRLAAPSSTAQGPVQQMRTSLPRVRGLAISDGSGAAALLEFQDEQIFVREGARFSLPGSGGGIEVVVEQIADGVTLQINSQQHWIPVR